MLTGLTVVADLATIGDVVQVEAEAIFRNTFYKAQDYNLQMRKSVGAMSLPHCQYGAQWPFLSQGGHKPPHQRTNGFLNEYVFYKSSLNSR